MEIRPNIYLLQVPIPDNPLGFLNSYLIKTDQGSLLIDTGWSTDEAFTALAGQLKDAGVSWQDIRYVVVTHGHPDHFGLVGRIVQHTEAKIVMHELEYAFVHSRFLDYEKLVETVGDWLHINGVPENTRLLLQRSAPPQLEMIAVPKPDMIVHGGEHLKLGEFDFEIIWTPGHAQGHICLYEPKGRMLFSGDHILAKITPNVSMHVQSTSSPLSDYLKALANVAALQVEIALPGHGQIISNLHERIAEIEQHHRDRNDEILQLLRQGDRSAYEVSARLTWATGGTNWSDLAPFSKRVAITETIAHLEFLHERGIVRKSSQSGVMLYSLDKK